MGHWYATCGISNLPIFPSEKTVLIPLINTYASNGYACYINDRYDVFGMPLFGEYDEYGGIGNVKNESQFVKFLSNFEFTIDGEPCSFDSYEDFQDSLWEKLKVINYGLLKKEHIFSSILILEEFYNLVVEDSKSRIAFASEDCFDKLVEDRYNRLSKAISLIKNDSEKQYVTMAFEKTFGDYTFYFKENKEWLINQFMFKIGLMSLRKGYHVISGNGSQAEDMRLHEKVALKTLEVIKRRIDDGRDIESKYSWNGEN